MILPEWFTDVLLTGLLLTVVLTAARVGAMHGDAVRWLKNIDASLLGHIKKNDKAHEALGTEQAKQGKKIAVIETRIEKACRR